MHGVSTGWRGRSAEIEFQRRARDRLGLDRRGAKQRDTRLEERRTQGHVLRPRDRPVEGREILYSLHHRDAPPFETDLPLEGELRDRHPAARRQFRTGRSNFIGNDAGFSVHVHPGGRLFVRRWTEQVEAQVVAHDAAQQTALDTLSVLRMAPSAVARRLDRSPWRYPQWIHAARLVQNLRDMSALDRHRHADKRILNLDRAAIMERDFGGHRLPTRQD